jgi:hypothetical protein
MGARVDLRTNMNSQAQTPAVPDHDEVEITDAALAAFGAILRSCRRTIRTHSAGDGGLICEDRSVRARPLMWRISPEGSVLPDHRYNFRTRAFRAAMPPVGLSRL